MAPNKGKKKTRDLRNVSASKTSNESEDNEFDEGPSDYELIDRIREGDMDAFETLMMRHAGKAFQIAYGILGHRNDAEEVAQDAFVRIFRALDKFRGDSEFITWM